MKNCPGCNRVKPLTEFPPDRRARDGKQSRCRNCINAWVKQHYRNRPAEHMLRRAKARATNKGLKFNLTLEDILPLPTYCPVFGFKLRIGRHNRDYRGYSLDRIDNRKGYVPGNVAVISYLANRLKNDGTAQQHIRIAEWMLNRNAVSPLLGEGRCGEF